MNEKLPPTHVLVVEVPLNLDDSPHDYSPTKDALQVTLAVSRAAFSGHICGDAQVTLKGTT